MYRQTLDAVNDEIPFGLEEPRRGGCCGGIDDAALVPVDVGSDEPQVDDAIAWFDMASLRRMLKDTAARIERETGGSCKVEALVSSEDDPAPAFMVWLSKDGQAATACDVDLSVAELRARLEVSVLLATRGKAVTA
jgi:hypothetical protein